MLRNQHQSESMMIWYSLTHIIIALSCKLALVTNTNSRNKPNSRPAPICNQMMNICRVVRICKRLWPVNYLPNRPIRLLYTWKFQPQLVQIIKLINRMSSKYISRSMKKVSSPLIHSELHLQQYFQAHLSMPLPHQTWSVRSLLIQRRDKMWLKLVAAPQRTCHLYPSSKT